MDPYAEAVADDWQQYHEDRATSLSGYTAGELAQMASWPAWHGDNSRILHASMPAQYPRPTGTRDDAIAYLRESARRQAERVETD